MIDPDEYADLGMVPQLIPEHIRQQLVDTFAVIAGETISIREFPLQQKQLYRYLLGYSSLTRPDKVKHFVLDVLGDVTTETWLEVLVSNITFTGFMGNLFNSFLNDELENLWEIWMWQQENTENEH
jgi:hypothetical protein